MPMPWTYRQASREFRAFLDDAKERMSLVSDNMAYTATDAVFRVFRRRLTPEQGIAFASVLPCVLSAIFIRDWDLSQPPVPFLSREEMAEEAKAVRRDHNLTPGDAIEAVAWALWRSVNHREFERTLSGLPPEARDFWRVTVDDPEVLRQRIV